MPRNRVSIIGCGWLGKPLAVSFLSKGYVVAGSTTSQSKIPELIDLGIEAHRIVLGPEFAPARNDAFFDSNLMIVNVPPRRRTQEPAAYQQQMEMLRDAIQAGGVSKTIMISTTSVYPDHEGDFLEEDADPEEDLVKVERLFQSGNNVESTIIRFAGLVGPGRHPGRFFGGRESVSDGDGVVNLIHLDDCIGIIHAIVEHGAWGQVFNGCAEAHPSRRAFYTKAIGELGLNIPAFKPGGIKRIINSTRVRTNLGYSFRFDDPLSMTF